MTSFPLLILHSNLTNPSLIRCPFLFRYPGKAVVIGLQSTGEAATEQAMASDEGK